MKLPTTTNLDPKQKLPFACPCGCTELEVTAKIGLQLKEGWLESLDIEDKLNDSMITCTKCKLSLPGVWFRSVQGRKRHEILSLLLGHMQANFDAYWNEGGFLELLLKAAVGLKLDKGVGEGAYVFGRAEPVEEKKA